MELIRTGCPPTRYSVQKERERKVLLTCGLARGHACVPRVPRRIKLRKIPPPPRAHSTDHSSLEDCRDTRPAVVHRATEVLRPTTPAATVSIQRVRPRSEVRRWHERLLALAWHERLLALASRAQSAETERRSENLLARSTEEASPSTRALPTLRGRARSDGAPVPTEPLSS